MFSNRDLRKLLIPLIIEQILMSLMGTADTMMVSNVGKAALSAVSLVDSINVLVMYLLSAMATGGAILCSQYIGHKEAGRANQAGRQLMMAVTVVSLVFTVVFIFVREPLLRLIYGTVDEEVMSNSLLYFTITVLSYPFVALNNGSAALFRAAGNSRLPMRISVVSNIMNIIGNALLIFVFHMGVAGAAIATAVSRMFAAVAILIYQHKPGQVITFDAYRSLRPDWGIIRRILYIGIPTGIENCTFQLGKLLVQSTVSTLGTDAMAVQAIVSQIELFTSMPGMAIGIGLVTVVGQCVGAGRNDEARQYVKKLTFLSFLSVLGFSLLSLIITRPITGLAGLSMQNAAETFRIILIIACIKPFIWSLGFTPAYGMRAAGDVTYSMAVSTATMWILRVGLCWYLCRYAGFGVLGVWIAMFSDWTARAVLFTIRFINGKWLQHDVIEAKNT